MPLDVVETLCDLVRLPSVNPMGRDVSGDEYFEYQVTDYLQRLFERLGWPWRRQPIEDRRDNLVARLDGDVPPEQGGAILMFEAHQALSQLSEENRNEFKDLLEELRRVLKVKLK